MQALKIILENQFLQPQDMLTLKEVSVSFWNGIRQLKDKRLQDPFYIIFTDKYKNVPLETLFPSFQEPDFVKMLDKIPYLDPRFEKFLFVFENNSSYNSFSHCLKNIVINNPFDRFNMELLKKYPRSIEKINNQKESYCFTAVKKSGLLLESIHFQTEDICLAALRNNRDAVHHLQFRTPKILNLLEELFGNDIPESSNFTAINYNDFRENEENSVVYSPEEELFLSQNVKTVLPRIIRYVAPTTQNNLLPEKEKNDLYSMYSLRFALEENEDFEDFENEDFENEDFENEDFENEDFENEDFENEDFENEDFDENRDKDLQKDELDFQIKDKLIKFPDRYFQDIGTEDCCFSYKLGETTLTSILKLNGLFLQYMPFQTENMCEVAVAQNINSFKFVLEPTFDLCEKMLRKNCKFFKFIKDKTLYSTIKFLQINVEFFQDFPCFTDEIVKFAISKYGRLLSFVNKITYEMCLIAVQNDGRALFDCPVKTKELCLLAVKQNISSILYVPYKYLNICKQQIECIIERKIVN